MAGSGAWFGGGSIAKATWLKNAVPGSSPQEKYWSSTRSSSGTDLTPTAASKLCSSATFPLQSALWLLSVSPGASGSQFSTDFSVEAS